MISYLMSFKNIKNRKIMSIYIKQRTIKNKFYNYKKLLLNYRKKDHKGILDILN